MSDAPVSVSDQRGRAQFTPGPWNKDKRGQLRGPDGQQVGVWDSGIAWVSRDDEAEANARLMKASPELYAALTAAKRQLWSMARGQWNLSDFKNWAVVQQIDAALEKADGISRTESSS